MNHPPETMQCFCRHLQRLRGTPSMYSAARVENRISKMSAAAIDDRCIVGNDCQIIPATRWEILGVRDESRVSRDEFASIPATWRAIGRSIVAQL